MASNFIWYELMTTDLEAARNFYTQVVGWTSESWPGEFPYFIMKPQGSETGVAGLMTIPEEAKTMGAQPMWLGYVHVSDVDAAIESVRKAGGAVQREPSDIPEVGRFSAISDPQGAMLMLMAPKGPDQPPLPAGTPGTVGWHELYTSDWQAALKFYSGQFGWTADEAHDMGEMGTYQLFSVDGKQVGGMMNKPPQAPMPVWLFYFNVPDINAAADRVKSAGGTVLFGPIEVPGGSQIIQGQDPQGAMFTLLQPAA